MTYENQTRSDHGAARSGQQREQMLREFFEDNGFTFMKTKKECEMYGVAYDGTIRHPVPEEYAECGFKYFLTDGYVLELDAVIELKGGDKSGTTEEKVFFDLEKLRDGCYGSCTVNFTSLKARRKLISAPSCSLANSEIRRSVVILLRTYMFSLIHNLPKKFCGGCKVIQYLLHPL